MRASKKTFFLRNFWRIFRIFGEFSANFQNFRRIFRIFGEFSEFSANFWNFWRIFGIFGAVVVVDDFGSWVF